MAAIEPGQKFGRWTVHSFAGKAKSRANIWFCDCECGNTGKIESSNLRKGQSKSCGCYQSEAQRDRATKHGNHTSPEYRVWANMKSRCENPDSPNYHRYGGRGISVCKEWGSFEAFYSDMGPRPTPKHSIDRIDNDGDYKLSNCRWATLSEQYRNRSVSVFVRVCGRKMILADAARELGIDSHAIKRKFPTDSNGVYLVEEM